MAGGFQVAVGNREPCPVSSRRMHGSQSDLLAVLVPYARVVGHGVQLSVTLPLPGLRRGWPTGMVGVSVRPRSVLVLTCPVRNCRAGAAVVDGPEVEVVGGVVSQGCGGRTGFGSAPMVPVVRWMSTRKASIESPSESGVIPGADIAHRSALSNPFPRGEFHHSGEALYLALLYTRTPVMVLSMGSAPVKPYAQVEASYRNQ